MGSLNFLVLCKHNCSSSPSNREHMGYEKRKELNVAKDAHDWHIAVCQVTESKHTHILWVKKIDPGLVRRCRLGHLQANTKHEVSRY